LGHAVFHFAGGVVKMASQETADMLLRRASLGRCAVSCFARVREW
jgi:hypothetical protein